MKKILPILVATALLALMLGARAQSPAPAPAVGFPGGYTPPPYTPTPAPAPVPIEKRTGKAYADALYSHPDNPLRDPMEQGTPNLYKYTARALQLVGAITRSPEDYREEQRLYNKPPQEFGSEIGREELHRIQEMEIWWDGMDSNERERAKRFNEWLVERLRKDGKLIPGIFRTIENRKP